MRAFKTVNDSYIEPISFIVPRRAEVFQDDIFPPVVGSKPAMSAAGWFDGKEGLPPKIDLASVYAGEEPAEVGSDSKPAVRPPSPNAAPSPTKRVPEPEPEPTPALRGPPPSMKEQTLSIKDLAAKFTDDKDDDGSEEDSSSFEGTEKPVDRSQKHISTTASQYESEPAPTSRGLGDALSPVKDKSDDFDTASQAAASQDVSTLIEKTQGPASKSTIEPLSNRPTVEAYPEPTSPTKAASGAHQPIQSSLAEIKSLLEQQTRTMSAQSQEISKLTAEVDRLRTKLGE